MIVNAENHEVLWGILDAKVDFVYILDLKLHSSIILLAERIEVV